MNCKHCTNTENGTADPTVEETSAEANFLLLVLARSGHTWDSVQKVILQPNAEITNLIHVHISKNFGHLLLSDCLKSEETPEPGNG